MAVIIIPLTAYKFNEELNSLSAEPETQENPAATMIQLRRQDYEKEMRAKRQRYQAEMEARQQQRVKAAGAQIEKIQRIRQNQLETKIKRQQIQEQIYQLHKQIHQLMQEYHTMYRSR